MERRHQPKYGSAVAFSSVDQDNRLPDRRVLGNLPRSPHRPSLIAQPKLKVPA